VTADRHRERLQAELCDLYYSAMPVVLMANVLNASLLTAYFLGSLPMPLLSGWLAAMGTIVAGRVGVFLAYKQRRSNDASTRWPKLAVLGSVASGIAWGVAGATFFSASHPEHAIVLGFVLGGMAAGSLAALTACLPAFQWYLLLSVLPFAIRLGTADGAAWLAMASMCVLYMLFLLLLGRRAHTFLRQSLLIRFEHAALVEGLERRIAERTEALQEANQRLSQDIGERLRAEATLADYARRQAAVASFGQRALSGAEVHTLFEEATSLVARQLQVDDALVIESDTGGLGIRAHAGLADTAVTGLADGPVRVTMLPDAPASAAEFALLHNQPVVSDDLTSEWRFTVSNEFRDEVARSVAAVVIPGRRQPFGVLQVHDRKVRQFSPDDVNFLQSIAATLAAAIERKQAERDIQRLALEDALTGLPNRALFRDQMLKSLARVKRGGRLLALMLLDLDHFKDINDTLGHPIGDRLLGEVAARLRTCGREGEAPARLGGDEFALIPSDLGDPEEAARIAQRIIDSIAEPFLIEGHEIRLSASLGITLFPTDGSDPDTLLRNADLALYRAKAEGRNTFQFFASHMAAQVEARKMVERDLRAALVSEGLDLHYQPQVELVGSRIIAAEALLRWQHRTRGPLMPDAFIPVAEASGLVVPLGTWVIEQVCQQVVAWRKAGLPPIVIAVNLSPSQCRRLDLPASLETIAEHSGCDLRFLEVEVTEQMFLPQESGVSVDCLRRLQHLGVTVSIDDFGTGYSSLGRLQGLPVDKVKIDRCFVSGVGRSRDAELIVGAMIALSRSLGLTVVAEGVETREQLDFLRAAGCHIAQGYYLALPMDATKLASLLEGNLLIGGDPPVQEAAAYRAFIGGTA